MKTKIFLLLILACLAVGVTTAFGYNSSISDGDPDEEPDIIELSGSLPAGKI